MIVSFNAYVTFVAVAHFLVHVMHATMAISQIALSLLIFCGFVFGRIIYSWVGEHSENIQKGSGNRKGQGNLFVNDAIYLMVDEDGQENTDHQQHPKAHHELPI